MRRLCGRAVSFYPNCTHLTARRDWALSNIFHISASVFSVCVGICGCVCFVPRPLTPSIAGERSAPQCRRTSNLFRHSVGRLMRHTCYPCTVISWCRAAKRSNITREITGKQREVHTATDGMRRKALGEREREREKALMWGWWVGVGWPDTERCMMGIYFTHPQGVLPLILANESQHGETPTNYSMNKKMWRCLFPGNQTQSEETEVKTQRLIWIQPIIPLNTFIWS